MICVYPADCTDFSTNGNGTLAPLSAEVTETLNGEYELTLVHPIDEAGKWQRLVEGFAAPGKLSSGQFSAKNGLAGPGNILRAPVPAAMTPRVNFTAPGDDNRTEVWRVNTDFSGAETRKGTLRLRSGPGTKYKVLATYKHGSFVQVIAKTNSSWYEVTMPPELRKAHQQNDRAVMEAYSVPVKTTTESSCVAELMRCYQELTAKEK